jgi:glycosyltransferase involved in cell wall biosynthesis
VTAQSKSRVINQAKTKSKKVAIIPDRVVIVMPAFNESGRVGKVVRELPKTITVIDKKFKVHVVVIDDCSDDDTAAEAKAAGATVLRHAINCGAGAATRTGFRYALKVGFEQLSYAVTIDADGQHKARDITRIVEYAVKHNALMIVGNRMHSGNEKSMPVHRTLGNRGLGYLGRLLFGIKTQDTQSGLRLVRASALSVVSDYTIDRYGFCTEMLWQAHRNGIVVHEVPISVTYSKETLSKGQSNWGVIDLVKDLFWIRLTR